jgi:hypothetical protein
MQPFDLGSAPAVDAAYLLTGALSAPRRTLHGS